MPAERSGKRVAVVGSGPAGADRGLFPGEKAAMLVTIFEAAARGGRGCCATPRRPIACRGRYWSATCSTSPRLGRRDQDPDRGRERRRPEGAGFRRGVHRPWDHEGERARRSRGKDLAGVTDPLAFLKSGDRRQGRPHRQAAWRSSAAAASRSIRHAWRCAAARREVNLYYRRSRKEMPAHDSDVQAALDEGVKLNELRNCDAIRRSRAAS